VERTPGFESPEAAALAGWRDASGAELRIISTEVIGERAEVVIAYGADDRDRDYAYFIRRGGRWHPAVQGSGPSHRWWDPSFLDWG